MHLVYSIYSGDQLSEKYGSDRIFICSQCSVKEKSCYGIVFIADLTFRAASVLRLLQPLLF